jgi:hypothetical protein
VERLIVALSVFIHPSAWKRNSANFACTEFSEVRYPQVMPKEP